MSKLEIFDETFDYLTQDIPDFDLAGKAYLATAIGAHMVRITHQPREEIDLYILKRFQGMQGVSDE